MAGSGEEYRVGDSAESFARKVAEMDEETAELQDKLRKLGGETTETTGKFSVYAVELERALAATKELVSSTTSLTTVLKAEATQVGLSAKAWEARNVAMEASAGLAAKAGPAATRSRAATAATVAAEDEALSAAPGRERAAPRRGYVIEAGADTAGAKYDVYGPGPTGGRGERMIGTAQTKREASGLIAEDQRLQQATRQQTQAVQQRTQAEAALTTAERQAARSLVASPGDVAAGRIAAGQVGLGEAPPRGYGPAYGREAQLALSDPLIPPASYLPSKAEWARQSGRNPSTGLPFDEPLLPPPERPSAAPGTALIRRPAEDEHGFSQAAAGARLDVAAEAELAAELARTTENMERQKIAAAELESQEQRLKVSLNQSVAALAEQSSALSRNGALTTEFLQAFARGDVTLKEFTSQMTSTIGKFGGWAVAGALVYGAYDAIKKLGQGATETQEGVQQLARFIPGVTTGPKRGELEGQFRDISQQFNEPISQVTSSMAIMARMFHNVTDAANATRAVFLASRLDQIAPEQSQTYLTGIAQSLNIKSGAGLVSVVGSLNELQNQLGARVSQTLPALARAAPAAEAGGLSNNKLEALVAVGVRAGIPGAQVGTAILRSIGTFAYRPASQETFRQLGVPEQDLQRGNYGGLVDAIGKIVTSPKGVSSQHLEELATALGGPLLGSRTLLPILEHYPRIAQAERAAAEGGQDNGQSAYAELGKVLGGVGQQFDHLGIELSAIGSELESAGLLEPVQLLAQAFGVLGQVVEKVVSPLELLGRVLDSLPTGAKDLLGASAGAGLFRLAARSNFGFATQQGLARLPGLGGLKTEEADQRRAVQDTVSRLRTYSVPESERASENAARRVVELQQQQQAAFGVHADATKALAADTGNEALQEAATKAEADYKTATVRLSIGQEEAVAKQEYLVEQLAIINTATAKSVTYAERFAELQAKGLVAQGQQDATIEQLARQRSADSLAGIKANRTTPSGGNIAEKLDNDEHDITAATAVELEGAVVASAATAAPVAALAGRGTPVGPAAGPFIAGPAGEAQSSTVSAADAAAEETATTDAIASQGLLARIGSSDAATAARGLGAKVSSVATGNFGTGGAFAALIGSQLAGSAIGGGAGGAISTIGGALGAGALAADFGGGALGSGLQKLGRWTGVVGADSDLDLAKTFSNPLLGAGLAVGIAGTAAGTSTSGTAGLVEGVVGGAAGGAAAGAPFAAVTDGLSVLAGGVIGGGLGAVNHLVNAPKGVSAAAKNVDKNAQSAIERILQGSPSLAGQDYAGTFNDLLNSAFNNGNLQDAQKQQTQIEQGVREQAQLLKDVGISNPAGQGVENLLGQGIGAAASSEGFVKDPYDVGQIIDSASQAQLTGNQAQFTFRLAQSPTAAGATRAVRQSVEDTARFRRHIAVGEQKSLTSENGAATAVSTDEGEVADERARIAALQQTVRLEAREPAADATIGVRGAAARPTPQDVPTLIGAGLPPGVQPGPATVQPTGVGGGFTPRDDTKHLETDGKKLSTFLADLAEAQATYKTRLKDYVQATGHNSQLLQSEIENTQTVAANAVDQVSQNAANLASVAASATGNPVTGAVANLKAALVSIAYNNGRRSIESPEAYATKNATFQAQANSARLAKVQGIVANQQAAEAATVAKINATIDPRGAAAAATTAAAQNLAIVEAHAKKLGPQAVSQAQAAYSAAVISQANTNQQYAQQQAADTAALTQAQNPANARLAGLAQATQGQTDLGLAKNEDQRKQALALIAQGNASAAEAIQTNTQATFQTTEAQQAGDPVAAALTGVAAARKALAQSLGPDQTIQANLQLAQATQALHQASQAQIVAIGQLKASQTNNTLAQDSDNLAAARKALTQALAGGYGKSVIRQDRTSVGTATLQRFNDRFSQRVATLSFMESTLQISQQGALEQIEKMQEEKGLSVSEREQLSSAAYQIETDQDNTSLFDLAPAGGAVTTPTIFDVRAAAERERAKLWAKEDRDGAGRLAREREESARLAKEHLSVAERRQAQDTERKLTAKRHDVGGVKDNDSVKIGGASIKTTSGQLNTYDLAVEAAVKAGFQSLLGALGSISSNSTTNHHHHHGGDHGDAAERAVSRVKQHLRAAGKRGT